MCVLHSFLFGSCTVVKNTHSSTSSRKYHYWSSTLYSTDKVKLHKLSKCWTLPHLTPNLYTPSNVQCIITHYTHWTHKHALIIHCFVRIYGFQSVYQSWNKALTIIRTRFITCQNHYKVSHGYTGKLTSQLCIIGHRSSARSSALLISEWG